MHMLRQPREHQDRRSLRLAAIISGAAIASVALVPAADAATATSAPPRTPPGVAPWEIFKPCYVFPDGDSAAEAYCAGTSPSQFRLFIKCTGGQAEYGPWRTAGSSQTSYAQCGSPNKIIIESDVETKN
jgi:hypothetical protein